MVGTAVAGSHKTRRCYNLKPQNVPWPEKGGAGRAVKINVVINFMGSLACAGKMTPNDRSYDGLT